MLAALAAVTDRLGLVGTINTTFNEPWEIARQFATLDVLSGGRAAWNPAAVRGAGPGAGRATARPGGRREGDELPHDRGGRRARTGPGRLARARRREDPRLPPLLRARPAVRLVNHLLEPSRQEDVLRRFAEEVFPLVQAEVGTTLWTAADERRAAGFTATSSVPQPV
ncbi:LLM class flavin-dependent oxidoreductase [Cellulomonas fimi]|uniref:LLM class flavin-dependent oxidoreductase n=1 Tax=Cellulomonas fimi TaxID=1708 RepID=UPI0035B20988